MRCKVVADEKIPFLKGVLEPYMDVVYLPGNRISCEDLLDADALLTRTRTICDASLLTGTRVRMVASATIGMDHVDRDFLRKNGIFFCNAPGCNAESVGQYVLSALLNLAEKYCFLLAGKTLGIVGAGAVGSVVARIGAVLGMRVLLNDPPRAAREGEGSFTGLNQLLSEADFITLHVPLDQSTFHLADGAFLGKMKKTAFLLNSSRGEVCDNRALLQSLLEKKIAGAVLDVWENEPEIDRELLGKVEFGTMHIAGYSADGKANGTMQTVRSVGKFFDIEALKNFSVPALAPDGEDDGCIRLDAGQTLQEALLFAVTRGYDIGMDSRMLKMDPSKFEYLRNHYRYRREGRGFRIRGGSDEAREKLKELGFELWEK